MTENAQTKNNIFNYIMKNFLFTIILLLGCELGFAQNQQTPQPLPFDTAVVKGTLPNGLTYYIQHNDNPRQRAFFYIAQKVGSVQEEENQRGLAHFLEHMCFNGSEHFPGNALIEYCQRIGIQFGADLNAYTAADRTVYNIDNVPTTDEKNLDSCLLILYDWSHALTLDAKEIDKERGVIHEEWRMRSSAMMRILERQLPTLMPGSKYGNRLPIGLMSVVDNFKPEVLRSYYEKWYRPDLQGIIIIGDIDVKQMEQKVKDLFGKIPAPKTPSKFEYYPVPDNQQPIIVVDKDKEVTTPDVEIAIKHNVLPRELRSTVAALPMDYITSILEQMFSYRFDDLLQNPDAPYNELEMGDQDFILATTKKALTFDVTPKDGKSEEAAADMMREIIRAVKYGFTDSEYQRAKTQFLSNLDQAREARKKVKTDVLVNECVNNFLDNELKTSFDTKYELYKQMAQMIPLNIVNTYLQKMVGKLDSNVVIFATYPEREGVQVPDKSVFGDLLTKVKTEDIKPYEAKTVDTKLLEKEPQAGSIKQELPTDKFSYKTLVLSNGIKVLYKSTDFDESKIIMSAVSKGGTAKLPLKELDNAQMFNDVIGDNGLGKFNSNDLKKALTGRQVSIAPQIIHNTENINGKSSPKDFRTFMQLVHLYFTELNYDTLNYRNVMKNARQELANRNANPTSALQDSAVVRFNGNNPRRQPFTLERLQNVSYDGIRKIYQERFGNPADFTFIFTGKINDDSIRTFAKLYLASLPVQKGKPEKYTDDGLTFWKGMQQCRFNKKMETPMAIMIQAWNGKYPFSVKNDAVCQAAGRILDEIYLQNVREKYSLAYSISTDAAFTDYPDPMFFIETACPVKPEKCDSALLLVDQGIKDIATNGVPQEYLAKVKEQMLKIFENSLRENAFWQGFEQDKILRDGRDGFTGYKEALQSITSADIQKFIRDVVMKQQNRLNLIMLPQ